MASLKSCEGTSILSDGLGLAQGAPIMVFDDTLTDEDFRRALLESYEDWYGAAARPEPDLRVEGLSGSFIARALAAFRRERR